MRVLRVAEGGFRSMAFGPNGWLFATGHHGGMVRLWDIRTVSEIASFRTPAHQIDHLLFSPDGQHLFGCNWRFVYHWRIDDLDQTPTLRPARLPNGRDDGTRVDLPCVGQLARNSLTISTDGKHLIGCDSSHPYIYCWPISGTNGFLRSVFHPQSYGLVQAIPSPDERTIASFGAGTNDVFLWDWQNGPRHSIPHHGHRVQIPTELLRDPLVHPAMVNMIRFSPDGETLATLAGRTLRVWDVRSRRERIKVTVSRDQPHAIEFTHSGRTVATVGNDRGVKFWDVETGRERNHFEFGIGRLSRIAFSPDGTIAAAGGMTRRMVMWDLEEM